MGQLSFLPSVGWKMSTGQTAVMLCSCEKRQVWLVPLVDAHVGVSLVNTCYTWAH